MDEEGFRQFLKRAGKKEHVIDGLVQQVRAFEAYLVTAGRGGLELAGERELHDYVQTLDPKRVKARMRGLALYYRFAGNEPLARRASEIREQRIAKTRQPFKLRAFRGVDLEEINRLEAAGIATVEDMLQAGSTPQARLRLSEGTGVGQGSARPAVLRRRPGHPGQVHPVGAGSPATISGRVGGAHRFRRHRAAAQGAEQHHRQGPATAGGGSVLSQVAESEREPKSVNVIESVFARRMLRRYLPRAVEREKLILLLQAAMAAPTACNSQPWEFIVVTEPEVLAQLRDQLYAGHYNAPAAIVVCGNASLANNSAARRSWVQDCSAATENILIAATGLGLGTVWVGVYPIPSVIKPVSTVLNVPEHVVPLCAVYVGYAAEQKPTRTQYDAHRVHWQRYEPRKKRAKVKNAKYLP
jgi:nitroreductase